MSKVVFDNVQCGIPHVYREGFTGWKIDESVAIPRLAKTKSVPISIRPSTRNLDAQPSLNHFLYSPTIYRSPGSMRLSFYAFRSYLYPQFNVWLHLSICNYQQLSYGFTMFPTPLPRSYPFVLTIFQVWKSQVRFYCTSSLFYLTHNKVLFPPITCTFALSRIANSQNFPVIALLVLSMTNIIESNKVPFAST